VSTTAPARTSPGTRAVTGHEAQVLQHLDDHAAQVVRELAELVAVPSVSGSDAENELQDLLARRYEDAGLEVDRWDVPLEQLLAEPGFPGVEVDREQALGVVARLPGTGDGPSLMLNAHVDVVPPGAPGPWGGEDPFSGTVVGDRLLGRGACDMKGGLVAAAWAVRAVSAVHGPLAGDLLLATVVGEEDGGLGTWAMLARGWRADACVIPEPTGLDLAPASSGALTFRLRVPGLATHASRRLSGVSAVEKLVPVLAGLRRLEAVRNAVKHPLMQRWELPSPIEIGTVAAGDWASSVPDLLVAEGRMGVLLGEDVADARRALEDAVAAVCADDPWLAVNPVQVQWWGGQFASGHTDESVPLLATVEGAHRTLTGSTPQRWGTPYGSDLRLMVHTGGVPTVHYGPGDAALAHGPRESVPVAEVLTAAKALALVALRHCAPR
jgi:acetylornithine deacetylase